MRIAQVIGTVILNKSHPTFQSATLKLAVPLTLDELTAGETPAADPLVVYDEFGANIGDRIMLSEGGEAAQPFRPNYKPVDAYNAGLLDDVTIHSFTIE